MCLDVFIVQRAPMCLRVRTAALTVREATTRTGIDRARAFVVPPELTPRRRDLRLRPIVFRFAVTEPTLPLVWCLVWSVHATLFQPNLQPEDLKTARLVLHRLSRTSPLPQIWTYVAPSVLREHILQRAWHPARLVPCTTTKDLQDLRVATNVPAT